MIHGAVSLVVCLVMLLLKVAWVGLLLPSLFYVGREVAQAEERYISAHGGKRSKCPWYCGVYPEAWNGKALLDMGLPIAVSVIAIALEVLWLQRN